MTYLTYLNYGTSAGNSDGEPVASHFVHRSELRLSLTYNCKLYLKKLVRKVENMVNVSYLRGAAITELHESSNYLHFHTYISSAGSFQPERVQYLPQSLTVNGRSGFFFPSSTTHPDFITSKYCGL